MADRPAPESRSPALRRVVASFLVASLMALAFGAWASAASGDWMWFARSGAVLTALGLVLASRKVLIARADLVALLAEMERADGAERTARLESFKRLQRDHDRQVMESAGFGRLSRGTRGWGFGDLLGRL